MGGTHEREGARSVPGLPCNPGFLGNLPGGDGMKRVDANEVDFEDYLKFLGEQESDSVVSMQVGFEGAMDRILHGPNSFGDVLPWSKTHNLFRMRPGEVTLWAGVNKHGKTEVLSHAMIPLAMESKVLVISLEMTLPALCERYLKQSTARGMPDRDHAERAMAAVADSYLVYDEDRSIDSTRILGVAAYAGSELDCKHIVIDSLVKCKLSLEQGKSNNEQRNFVDKLALIAKQTGTHIHLVHHMRKGESEDKPGNKMDVKGAGELTDLVDNIALVWRNKPKEKEIWEANLNGQPYTTCEHFEEPDTLVSIAGQRAGGDEGSFGLWFHKESRRFMADAHDFPDPYVR